MTIHCRSANTHSLTCLLITLALALIALPYSSATTGEFAIKSFEIHPAGHSLTWESLPGRSYHIHRSIASLNNWKKIGSATTVADDFLAQATLPDPGANSTFYRVSTGSPVPLALHVATDGDDTGDGLTPTAAFATLQRARDEIRQRITDGMDRDIIVFIHAGKYLIEEPIQLGSQDSGCNGFTITYRGHGGPVEILGARLITGWEEVSPGHYRTHIPAVQNGTWQFDQIFDNGQRQRKARHPNIGYLSATGGTGNNTLQAASLPAIANPSDAQVIVWASHDWFENTLDIASYNSTAGHLTTTVNAVQPITAEDRFYLQGAIEFLDQPGEFHLDSTTGILDYRTDAGNPNDRELLAPTVTSIFEMIGDSAEEPVKDIRIENLTLGITRFLPWFRETDHPGPTWNKPAAVNRTGIITLRNARNIAVHNCILTNAGLNGIAADTHTRDCIFERLEIRQCGYHAILLTGSDVGTGIEDNRNHRIENNLLENCGALVGHAGGVFLYQSAANQILNNEIRHMPRYGVCLKSMRKGIMPPDLQPDHFTYLTTRNNRIENNRIHAVIQDSSDAGAITLWGTGKGNIIRNNHLFNIAGTVANGLVMGVYLDDGADHVTVEKNLVHDVSGANSAPIIIKGIGNIIRHNIFSRTSNGISGMRHLHFAGEPVNNHTIEHNIVFIPSPTSEIVWSINSFTDDLITASANNLFWVTGGSAQFVNLPVGNTFTNWQTLVNDTTSLIADPLFTDPANGDFSLLPASPARTLGFDGIDFDLVGPQSPNPNL